MFFGNGHEACGAIDLAGRGVNDPPHGQVSRRLKHVQRAFDIGIDVGIGRVIRVWDGDQRGEMQNAIATLHRLLHTKRITDVACEDVEPSLYVGGTLVEPSPGIEGVVEHESADVVAGSNQRFGEV